MEKRHVGRVLFFENLISSLLSIAGGLFAGMVFYKLCSLLICRLLQTDAVAGFYYVTPITLLPTAGLFLALDLFIFLLNRISVTLMKPVALLQSSSAGEKEPKIKWDPCRVIRKITDEDKRFFYKNIPFDEEAWNEIVSGKQAKALGGSLKE